MEGCDEKSGAGVSVVVVGGGDGEGLADDGELALVEFALDMVVAHEAVAIEAEEAGGFAVLGLADGGLHILDGGVGGDVDGLEAWAEPVEALGGETGLLGAAEEVADDLEDGVHRKASLGSGVLSLKS